MDLFKRPESPDFVTIKVVGVQHLAGRQTPYVRCFGYRVEDPKRVIVEVAVNATDATDIITRAAQDKEFPEIEVPRRSICAILSTGEIQTVHFDVPPEDKTS